MMGISLGHLIILLVILLLFGGKRIPELAGALGKGLRSFKQGMEGKVEGDPDDRPRVDGPKPAAEQQASSVNQESGQNKS
jgi:sec-independent protein translocase protein TatA